MEYEKLDRKTGKNERRLSCKIDFRTGSQSTICLPIDGEEYELVNYFDGICIKQMCNLDKHWIVDVRERDRHRERVREKIGCSRALNSLLDSVIVAFGTLAQLRLLLLLLLHSFPS